MNPTDVAESRIRGYLFVLGQSLRSFLPREVATDALREVETHIRERLEQTEAVPDERIAVERVLAGLGSPLRVAQAYSMEMAVDEAVVTGRVVSVARAVWQLATATIAGFFTALGLFVAYASGIAFLLVAAAKPLMPDNVGLLVVGGIPRGLGAFIPVPPGGEIRGGYWIVPICLVAGLGILVGAHRGARRILASWRSRIAWRRQLQG
jgi:uncharacterized membrane protein